MQEVLIFRSAVRFYVEHEPRQERTGCFVPVYFLGALVHRDHHIGDHAGIVDRIGAFDVDQVQRIEPVPTLHHAEGIQDADFLA